MAFENKRLQCVECGVEFVWTAGEQAFFAGRQFTHEPRRCRACKHRQAARPAPPPQPAKHADTEATCSACGRITSVPFRPAHGRPVYCRECFQQRRRRRT